jgi:hypothetical protein
MERLSDFARGHTFKVLQSTGELIRLSNALETAGVRALFFKGAVLGEQIYGGASQREFNDIDLLIAPADQDRVIDILEDHGYQPVITDQHFRHAFFDYAGQHMFRHCESAVVVDLHWNFVGRRGFPLDALDALCNRIWLSIGAARVPAPCFQDLALILAGHGQKEGWASFGWALDFAQFASSVPDFDWSLAAERARTKRSIRGLLTAILLIHREFGTVIDVRLLSEAQQSPELVKDVDRIYQMHLELRLRKLDDDLMGSFRLCESPLQKALVWFDLLTIRTLGDYECLPLPKFLWWTYFVTRPFRLAWLWISGAGPSDTTLAASQDGPARRGE